MKLKLKNHLGIAAASVLVLVSALRANAASTPLPLRYQPNGVYLYGGGLAGHMIENSFGTDRRALAFTGTSTYDFYSPPLLTGVTLTTSEKAGGTIVMSNSAP